MPGWAGQPEPRTDGPQECAWHCAPFTEGAQYGIEVFWPWEGRTHIFRLGEPILQILILPLIADFDLVAMDEEEAVEREMRGRRIHGSGPMLAEDTTWTSRSDAVFDGKRESENNECLGASAMRPALFLSSLRDLALGYALRSVEELSISR